YVVSDLYTDIQQGHLLLDLLEVLSGQHLPREKGFNTFQCRSNIENALTFLKSRSLKLINIHVADIIEGKPSIVLGLIWTIIFHFHIEELARTLACTYNQPSPDGPGAADSSPKANRSAKKSAKIKERWKMSATKALLLWAKEQCSLHGSVSVTDFKSSWRSGLAFLAIIQTLRPGLVDLEKAKARSNKENLKEAFRIAELELNIPRLLEPEDVDTVNPDEKSIMTYVAQFLQYSKNLPESEEDMQEKVREAMGWLAAQEEKLAKLLVETENEAYYQKYKEMMSFMETFNQEKIPFLPVLSSKRGEAELSEGQQQMREQWDKVISQINEWKAKLDQMLPSPLDSIEAWLQEVERLQAEDLPDLQDPFKAMSVFREIIVIFKGLMDCFDSHLDTLQSFKNEDEKNMPLVLPEKLEEMKRRFSNIRSTNPSTFLEYHYGLCSAIANEVKLKLNIWDVKYGAKESVESLLENWNNFIEEKKLETQLDTATHICEDLKNIKHPDLAGDRQEISKLLKTVESKISTCKEYISNVNTTLQKVLSSWSNYTENIHLLKTWLEENRNEDPKEIPAEVLAKRNSIHGSLNEAGNHLIEVSKEQVGSNIAKELKKLNRRWAKFIKRTHFVSYKLLFLFAMQPSKSSFLDLPESANAAEETTELPGSLEKIEELLGGVDSWAAEMGHLLSKISHEEPSLAARGSSCKDQVVAAEEILQSLRQNVSSQVLQQHSHTTGLEARIKEARDKVEVLVYKHTDISNFIAENENPLSGLIRSGIFESRFFLVTVCSGVFICCVTLSHHPTGTMLCILQAVRQEIVSYVQLIIEREKKKFNATLKKINKQLGKEKKLLSMDKTKGLIKEHEVPDTFLFCLDLCILEQIEECKQLEHLDSSAGDEVNPLDLQAARKVIINCQKQLEEMRHKMQIREAVLKDLETFMASLKRIQSSITSVPDPPDQPEMQGKALREAAQEVSHLAEEAKSLDERLKSVNIGLEDADHGRKTWCEKLVQALSKKLNAIYDPSREQVPTGEKDLHKTFSRKNSELLKTIQDLRDRINKIGLKDPTIPAIQKRIKSLTELEKELDRAAAEMKSLQEIANKLPQINEEKAEEANEQCRVTERLWEDTKLLLAECQEQCARVLELLKQYQSCKTSLTSIIQKQEIVLSQQTSYMGKENLNRLIAKIEEAKEEFNDHSEDVDKINQICKNLQFQLNKMRSFEEPPFENEANIIVDRWLDINEKTENYCDNLGRAQALWDKLLNLSGTIEAWADEELKNAEDNCLTEEYLAQLKACLRAQEQKLQKFDNTVAEIEELLNSNEPPLELQVIRSSVVQKMELIKELLSAKRGTSELTVNTAELKGDLDLAKTQIGMTESLLKALSPSDTLEIFTKLEEIHQKILQQEHLVALLQEETDCPDVDELNKQLKCVTDLFNSKKHVLQDHFMGVLNRQCKNFNDWFSSTQLSLKDCFEPSETKAILEERLQRLKHFLTSEGRDRDIQEVKALLNKVKPYLPKASINHLSSRVRDQEAELQRLISKCQKREQELGASLQHLSSLEESSMALKEWLSAQEEKVKEINKDDTELEDVYKTLLMQRKPFDSLAQLSNSLEEAGLTEYETLSEASNLISRYHALITRVSEMAGNAERLAVEGQNFEDLAQDVSCWIKKLEEALNKMSSQGRELPSDERINQIKEITSLRDEGEAKIQSMVALGATVLRNEKNKKPEVQQTVSELQKKWENLCQLATEYSSPQEQLQCNREQYEQSKEDLKQALMELEKQQQEIFALQPGLEEKQAQLANYADLLQKTEALTSQFSKLKSQENLQGHTVDPCFTEAEWSELKHQHENLLSQLQVGTSLSFLSCCLQFSLYFSNKMFSSCSKEQQGPLSQSEDTAKKSLVLAETVKQNTSSPEQEFIEDEMETLQSEHKERLEERLENVKQKKENIFSEALELKDEFGNEIQKEGKADTMLKRETQITSDTPISAEETPTAVELKEPLELSDVSLFVDSNNNGKLAKETSQMSSVYCTLNFTEVKPPVIQDTGAEVVVQKELFPAVQVNNEYFEEEQKVNELKNEVAELDMVLINEQLKELEVWKLQSHSSFLIELCSKRGPMNNTVLLEKIKACIESLRKERDVLNQLQSQQEVLSQHLTCMDKVLTESQMRQLEHWWQHMEQAVQKKHDQVVAEIDEFNLLMNKARDIQRLIQEQYLQAELHSSAAGKAKDPLIWTTELQDIKHGLSLLKRRIELQMKRIWSDQEKVALENSIQDLQCKLEALSAQQTPQEDIQTTGPALMKHEMMKRLKENISWVKDSLSHLDQKAALFPSDVKSQIRNCQLMNTDILNREPVILSLDYGLQHILPSLEPEEGSDMTFLLQTLKNSYKALVLKSAQRLQHLELQLEERQRLTAEIDKVHSQLCKAELMARPDPNQNSSCSELVSQQGILKEMLKDIQEIEELISSHCKESQVTAGQLSLSEQLFLIDQLRSLKNRARKTQRQIQSKLHEVEQKTAVSREFAEGIASLQQDLDDLQDGEMNLKDGELVGAKQGLKDKCKALKEKVLAFQSGLSQVMKYKEIFECVGLKWDSLQLDELQTKFSKIKNKIKEKIIHLENIVREWDKIQGLLDEIQTVTSTVRKEANILNDSSSSSPAENVISAQILLQAVQQILYLTQEAANQINKNEVFDSSFKESKRKEIKSLEKNVEELKQFLQNLVSGLQSVNKEGSQDEAENIFHIIRHIQLELQQPLVIDINTMQDEKLRWEAIQNMMEGKLSALKCIMEKEREKQEEKSPPAATELEPLQGCEAQLKADIAARVVSIFNESEALTYAAADAAELCGSGEICQTPHWKEEEFNSAKADLEKLHSKLKNLVKPEDQACLEDAVRELVERSLALSKKAQRKEADEYFEKHKSYTETKDKVCDNLKKLEKMLRQSLSKIPVSYKEALEHLEDSKVLVSSIDSAEEDLVKLRQISGEMMRLCRGSDRALGRIVTVLWENWLGLLEAAKGLEITCEELKQEWKFINEELERETIILDKLQEEQPESLKEKEKATREELVELLDFVNSFEENINQQQLLLLLLLHRIRNILNAPEDAEGEAALPALAEIKAMQERCKKLYKKAQDHKDSVKAEIQERNKVIEEISAVTNALQNAASVLLQDADGKAEQLEVGNSSKPRKALEDIMEKLRIKYSEMYTIVPAEIETQLEDCKKVLHDLEEKVSSEILQNSPQYVLKRKAETINNGLQAIEKMLQQKSENIAKAKEVQKQIWDMLDLWHYKLNELDAEVQDIVEQNACHAQELMDILVAPLQQYQQVSQRAERRTAILNKATSKMEEYEEHLKNVKDWIESTNSLLRADAQHDSAKSLHKHTDELQMALEDSEQKQNLLHGICMELEELSAVFETDSVMQQLNEIDVQVAALQHEIAEILPQILHVADLDAIESHVKVFEKDVAEMKTILSSEDLLEFSPKDQLKHGQVILEHVGPMQKTIVHIQSYEDALQLPGLKMQPFSVFQRARQLLRELKKLEKITKEQNELLEVIDLFFSMVTSVKEEIIKLCQRKEDFLSRMKNSMSELHQCLQQEVPEAADEPPASVLAQSDLVGTDVSPQQVSDHSPEGQEGSQQPPPVPSAALGSQSALDGGRPEPESILLVCQAQVAELEQWLAKTKMSLGSAPQTPQRQQMVEPQLADCQVRLSEIEQKVLSLLEDCGDSADYQQKTEALSLKLKEVKRNLENVQMMLQDKHSEEQVKHVNVLCRARVESPAALLACGCRRTVRAHPVKQGREKCQSTFSGAGTPTVEELKTYTVQLGDLSQEANVVHAQDNVAEEVSSSLDRKLFELLLAISRCLNNMEEMLNTSVLSTEEAAVQQALYETLSVELQKLHADLSDKKDDLLKSISCAGGSTDVFCECFNNLQARLEQTQAATASRSSSMKAGLDHNSNYLKIGDCAVELQNFENQVAKLRGHGERLQLPITLIQEAYKLEDVLDDMWGILKAKYVELNSPAISESQYEDLLRGFAELVAIGREKMAQDPKHLTKSRAALQSHLKNHKDFFHNLMTRMAYMEAFAKRVSPSVLQKREEFWRELVNEVKLLEQKACQYGIHLESLLKDWVVFDEECLVFNKELEALASVLPSVSLVEETEERLMERIALLEKIKSSVDEKHARLYQMVKEGKKLLTAVNCPEIRSQIGNLEEQWLFLTKKVGHELHRLQTLLKLLVSYNRDSEELMKWLDSAQQRMNFWKEQSLNVSQDLATIRDNISSLFTFSKEVDEKSSLKSSVVSTASQLLHVKQADTAALRSSLAKFEQKWGELITQLPAIQEKLHQLQMEKLSSREAIAELMAWLDHVEQQQEREEPINSQGSAAQVKTLLQKYKEYMMEMNFKQWMVDFVNQSLLQMSTCDVESKRYERTEFAECLGEMNLRWHRLQAALNRKIQDLEHILEDITENENKAQTLHNWLEAQSDRLRSLQTPASLISAQNTLDDCKELENQLVAKSEILDELKKSLASNGSAEQTPETQSLRIAELCEMKDSIVNQVAHLKASMESILEQWRAYDEIYAEVSLMTTRYLYCIDQCKPSEEEASLEALKKQVKTLQALQDESESSEESWAKLQAAASNLKKICSPSFAEIIDQKCMEAHTRWNSVNEDITDQLRAAQAALQLWEPFEALCSETAAKLEQYNQQCLILFIPLYFLKLTQKFWALSSCGEQASILVLHERKAVLFCNNLFFPYFQNQTLELAALSPSIESLNEASIKLPLSDFTLKKMQSLTRQWSQKTAAALECCSMLEGTQNDEKKFFQKCEKWMKFLEKMKEALKTDIPGRFEELQEQQRVYEVKLTLKLEFISKLTLLKEQWQNVIRMVQQRKKDVDGLVSQWQLFRSSLQSLSRFLDDTNSFLAAVKSQDCYSLYQLRNIIHDFKTCDCFEKQTKELESRLQELKEKVKDPLPVEHEELHKAKEHIKVSLRKQEIEDRLNAWIVFNEKNKELCSWLVQMESKVLQTADVSIEDMIDKLQKVSSNATLLQFLMQSRNATGLHLFTMFVYVYQDCMEEINLFSENKLHLKQMGDQLIKASNKSRVAEIDDKLNKINDRWQHLFDVIGARMKIQGSKQGQMCLLILLKATILGSWVFTLVKKLKETFAFIQQLDKNMSNLRTWLARIESELSKPVVYDICDDQEIQKRLAEQQDLQRDIEQHTAGVESVFNICEVLLHDSDACANETECDSIQQTTRSLDRRWRNICAMSMERRMKIEETWRLWQRFLDDYSRFEDWLKASENIAARPNSSEVLYTHAKEELKKFERQIHERLTQLELINKQYRRLARENRTDSASKLKQMVHEGNQRWDNLQKRVASILRRLKHFTNRRDEFEGTRESILVWLTEMDLQLTNVEHFSKSNFDDKMRQLNGFQQEITLNTNKIDQLIVFGEQLIQKSEPLDAILIEDELEELHRYCQEGLDDEKDNSENETDQEDSREIQNDPWHKKAITEGPSSTQSLCHLVPPTQGHERSGCETPVSVDSIPLEWDHTGDVGGSSSHEDDEEATYYSALSGKSVSEARPWHSPGSPVCRKHRYNQAEMVGNVLSGPETSTPYKPDYVSWRLSAQLCIIDRWELIQAQDLRNKLRMKQKLQQWQQLDSDLSDISAWLDKTEQELEELQKVKLPTSMQALEQKVKKLKDMLKAFDSYKAVLLSANLSSKEFQKADSTEFKELQNRLRKVNLHWEKANRALDSWRKGLQQALLHCQDFHDQSQKLILWLASAESRRNEAQITDPNADLNTILECQKELMQLEKELLEQQLNVNSLQELTAYLLLKSDGDYIEEEEKVHVIGTKLKQLIEQVSHDLKTIQGNLVSWNLNTSFPAVKKCLLFFVSPFQERKPFRACAGNPSLSLLLLPSVESSFTPAAVLPAASAAGLHDPLL
uniref:Spectrin repeat containing nuclear envelope protein 2 n=1 Tax=Junco hyemalis TaxID=40217 RepID=A0A8C5NQZ7_JUNHY